LVVQIRLIKLLKEYQQSIFLDMQG